jgi:hypothetical protein
MQQTIHGCLFLLSKHLIEKLVLFWFWQEAKFNPLWTTEWSKLCSNTHHQHFNFKHRYLTNQVCSNNTQRKHNEYPPVVRGSGYVHPEFGRNVSKVKLRIVPPENRTQALLNDSFKGNPSTTWAQSLSLCWSISTNTMSTNLT